MLEDLSHPIQADLATESELISLLCFKRLTGPTFYQLIPNMNLPSMKIPLSTMFLTTITNMNSSYIIPSHHIQICE
jgi:hypothetical protein